MELVYPGKKQAREILDAAGAGNLCGEIPAKNWLIKGENLVCLQGLRARYANKIDLIYIDPPFSTNTTFTIGAQRVRTISTSRDDAVAYSDNLSGPAFIEFIRERLIAARELLSDVGSIYLHSGYKTGHYIKIIMDEVFGIDNFRNDITRVKCNPKNFYRPAYGNIKDMLLFYSKTNKVIWNDPKLPFSQEDKEKLFKKIDKNGRRYTTIPLHAPGETKNGATAGLFKGLKPPEGRHWRCNPQELEALDRAGLIEWSKKGNPRKIRCADERGGKKMQDIWEFKDPLCPLYPTEKNSALLKTVIAASSYEGSTVMDFFCGSGTTLLAAQELNRNWIGIDNREQAITAAKEKLRREGALFADSGYAYAEIQ
jgi:adenine-specific DNA-methyltransferase